ncbi:MAG: glycogen synthase [Sandaracinus sp.]
MRVLFVSSEVAPFAKTGGLGDVCGALPKHLRALGHDVRPFVPLYAKAREKAKPLRWVFPELSVELGPRRIRFGIATAPFPGTDVPCYFVVCPELFDRPSIYTTDADEHLRFCVLSWAALKTCQAWQWSPEIVHAHDWQTALMPLIVKFALRWDRIFQSTKSVFTIHNIGYQGSFSAGVLPDTGLAEIREHFHQDLLNEGKVNFMLHGVLYADAITTVSPTYAREIMTPEHGVGMDPFLRGRGPGVLGILNGIDEDEWSPEKDKLIPQRYGLGDWQGKEANKRALLSQLGLPYHPRAPLFGIVSRLAWQKGFELCEPVLPGVLARHDAQLVVLGTGEARYEQFFARLQAQFPHKVRFVRAFSEPMAHTIEAASDLFLMPSRYEPCGLNQMYSLRYGTVPIVHKTGGLADTVVLYRGRGSEGNGVLFDHFDARGFRWAIEYALELWGSGAGPDRERFREIQSNGMRAEHGWPKQAQKYVDVYRAIHG